MRGLAARLNADKRSARPWSELRLEVSVYAQEALPVERVIEILQPFAGTEPGRELVVDEQDVEDGYLLVSDAEPVFLTVFWPASLSRSRQGRPALAVGRDRELCRWQLRTTSDAATADLELCRLLASAGLALAGLALAEAGKGTVVDMAGFPVTTPDELLPA